MITSFFYHMESETFVIIVSNICSKERRMNIPTSKVVLEAWYVQHVLNKSLKILQTPHGMSLHFCFIDGL